MTTGSGAFTHTALSIKRKSTLPKTAVGKRPSQPVAGSTGNAKELLA
jgi:hypothetical protein